MEYFVSLLPTTPLPLLLHNHPTDNTYLDNWLAQSKGNPSFPSKGKEVIQQRKYPIFSKGDFQVHSFCLFLNMLKVQLFPILNPTSMHLGHIGLHSPPPHLHIYPIFSPNNNWVAFLGALVKISMVKWQVITCKSPFYWATQKLQTVWKRYDLIPFSTPIKQTRPFLQYRLFPM